MKSLLHDIDEIWENLPFEIKEEPQYKGAVLEIIDAIIGNRLVPRAKEELFEAVKEGIERAILNDSDKRAYLHRILHRKPRTFPAPTSH